MDPPVFLVSLFLSSVLAQSTQGPALPQCQCIPDSTGKGCIQYDSRFQAATLNEAMASFPDLTVEKNETDAGPTLEAQAACTSQECLDCQTDLDYKLKKVGLIPLQLGEILPPTTNMSSTCKQYKFAGKDAGVYDKDSEEHHIYKTSTEDSDSDESDDQDKKRGGKKKEKKHDSRKKRQAVPTTAAPGGTVTVVGQRYTLSCTAKGVATDTTGYVSLCSACWVWRRLPDNYSPQYINELICDQSDGACLSGYATCGIGHRSIDVVQTVGNTRTTVSISAGSYCECKVARSSSLLTFVTGNSTTAIPLAVQGLTQG